MTTESHERLSSWKEIADYLKCHEKTARRWEKSRGLPVHRVPGGTRSSVIAYREEIEAWMKSRPPETESVEVAEEYPCVQSPESLATPPILTAKRIVISLVISLSTALVLWALERAINEKPAVRLIGEPRQVTVLVTPGLTPLLADNRNLYIQTAAGGRFGLLRIDPTSGTQQWLDTTLPNPDPGVVAKDGSAMLLRSIVGTGRADEPLYLQPRLPALPRRLGNIVVYDSAWTPDGAHIIYGTDRSVYLASTTGTGIRKLFDVPGRGYHFRFAPDGTLRFTVYNRERRSYQIWESASFADIHPRAQEMRIEGTASNYCCGEWSAAGDAFFFQGSVTGRWQLFGQPIDRFFHSPATQLTSGLAEYTSPLPAFDGQRIYAIGESNRSELIRFDKTSSQWVPFLPGNPIKTASVSADGRSVAYTASPDDSLWRCELPDCAKPVRLTAPGPLIAMPRWSPDGRAIACMIQPSRLLWQIAVISPIDGDRITIPVPHEAGDPTWSPDGRVIAFSSVAGSTDAQHSRIEFWRRDTGEISSLAGGEGYDSPSWSPDGRYMAAVATESRELSIYDFAARTWRRAPGSRVGYLTWTHNGKAVCFLSTPSPASVMCADAASLRFKTLANLTGVKRPSFTFGGWIGLNTSGEALALRDVGTSQIISWEYRMVNRR